MSTLSRSKWKRLGKKTAYKGRVHILEYDVELPDGSLSKYEVDHSAGRAVAVLIRTTGDEIILSHQYRFPLDEWIYDLPGGGADPEETLEQAAIRECQEEVGIIPSNIQKLATFFPNPGRSDWSATIFYCDEYKETKTTHNDPSEVVERVCMPIKEFGGLIEKGAIIDPSLLIGWHTAVSRGLIETS